ncbi:DUF2779 domain-containing protein [Bacteroidia bacterium]|nr:DUF2779 domain-containing protein [Bacteroidia bacterium]
MRYLTKSLYKIGLECPNKLYYIKKEQYANQKQINPFLKALASGGFQVEQLARLHYPDHKLVKTISGEQYDHNTLVTETNNLLLRENVVIFEAAFRYKNLFIRADILEKKGNQINLIEVKAKSFKENHKKKDVTFNSDWKFYLFDVAFQKYVIEKVKPALKVTPFLMLADQDKKATTDGLNQMFRIKKNNKRAGVEIIENDISTLDLPQDSILSLKDVTPIIKKIEAGEHRILNEYNFQDSIQLLSKAYQEDRYFNFDLNFAACKKCEFKTDARSKNEKSGYKECFSKHLGMKEEDFKDPSVFEISRLHPTKLEFFNQLGVIKLKDIDDEQLKPKTESKQVLNGWSLIERQILQKKMALTNTNEPFKFLKDRLKQEIDSWNYPLNFIDFEASTVALPFHSGQSPYEKVVFQFSHHIVNEKGGRIEHANEYINLVPGEFPNFKFVRALYKALSQNNGTIFQYSPYENSTLNQVKSQIEKSDEPDRNQLIDFIKSITTPPSAKEYKGETWKPNRGMVDLCEVIKAYYYNPKTKGSNSIKDVLPAIFKTSPLIRKKYSCKISDINMSTKNFPLDHIWLKMEDNEVIDPYRNLEKPFEDWNAEIERVSDIDEINNGGAALTAYGLSQYTDMVEEERTKLEKGLLKYCELDTLAMVMIYEHLEEITSSY